VPQVCRGHGGGVAIRWVLILLLLPGLVMAVLALLRVRFARVFWRRMYIIGLVYVAIVVVRAVAEFT
jgi:hypothetical protein